LTQVLAVVASLALASCDGTSPPTASGITGSYELILVDDKPPPAVIATVGLASSQERVVSGELVFSGRAAMQRTDYDLRERTGELISSFQDSVKSTFTVNNQVLLLTRASGSTTISDSGYVDGSAIILRQRLKNSSALQTTRYFTLKYLRR